VNIKKIRVKKEEGLEDLMKKFEVIEQTFDELPDGEWEIVIQKPTRTSKQNRAMHLYFTQIAQLLNEHHLYLNRSFFKEGFDLLWDGETVKKYLWKEIQKFLYDKKSTRQLTTKELSTIADALEKNLALKGIDAPFPNIDILLNE
jgi:hypothetical protein